MIQTIVIQAALNKSNNKKTLLYTVPRCIMGNIPSVGRVGTGQPVVRHRQTDVVVVPGGLLVIGPADGQDVLLGGGVLGEVVVADDSPMSEGGKQTFTYFRLQL